MRFLFVLLALFMSVAVYADTECKVAPSSPEDRRSDPNKLRVVQFNAEWLFIDEYNGCPGSSCTWENETIAQTHLEAISSVVADLNPDIVNFCEIEGCDELQGVMDQLEGFGYEPYLIFGDDSSTGQDVGFLSRIDPVSDLEHTEDRYDYPIEGNTCGNSATGTKGCSKHYVTTFSFNNMNVAMFGVHFLAHPDDTERCLEREAQAMTIRDMVEDYSNQGYEIILLGDMNDFDADVLDTLDDVPISRTLSLLKAGLNGDDKPTLQTCGSLIDKDERFSEWYDKNNDCQEDADEYSKIDHVLLSQGLFDKVSNVFISHDSYSNGCDSIYSDHWPVVVDFDFTE